MSWHLLQKYPFFCKILDIGQSISGTGEYLLVFEALEGDLEEVVDKVVLVSKELNHFGVQYS